MIIQFVKFETTMTEGELMATAKKRLPEFQKLPGLLQKYYVKGEKPNQYGGVYVWDSIESLKAYRNSDLARTIPQAYKVVGEPSIEILDSVFQLRE